MDLSPAELLNVRLTRSDFVLACDPLKNPRADAIERASTELAEHFGLLRSHNHARFMAFNPLASYSYPTADVERGIACAQWDNWLFFFDDVHDENYVYSSNVRRVERGMRFYLNVLRSGDLGGETGPLALFTLDFRERVLGFVGHAWLERFCQNVQDYLEKGVLPAVRNWIQHIVPEVDNYLLQREFDSAVHNTVDLIEIAEGLDLPDQLLRAPAVTRIRQACVRTVAYFNDIVSYPKEVIDHNNPNNLVHVIMYQDGCSYADAIAQVVQIANSYTQTILDLEEEVAALDPAFTPMLRKYTAGMKYWQRGNVEWSLTDGRYRAEYSPFPELR